MPDHQTNNFRMWSWAKMPPVGKRAYVLKMARNLLQAEGITTPDSWMAAWADAARGLAGAASPSPGGETPTVDRDAVPPAARLSPDDWTRLRALVADSPLDEALAHKAAVEFMLREGRRPVPVELVDMTLTAQAQDV